MAVIWGNFDTAGFWEASAWADAEYVERAPGEAEITAVESVLGYSLPRSYIELMQTQNGGCPARTCHRTATATSWAKDHVAISAFKGIGSERDWSLCGNLGSRQLIEEWDYPDLGIYFGDCPSAGHDVLCLDYRECGRKGPPTVVHIDQEQDYRITFVAKDFEAFVRGLRHEAEFNQPESP